MQCNWNTSWTLEDSLDPCGEENISDSKYHCIELYCPVWVQCINPPLPPPESQLKLVWSGAPVEFGGEVSYQCREEGLYFEAGREIQHLNVTCLTDGSWAEPAEWPRCIRCKDLSDISF